MSKPTLFRKRIIPDETVLLKDDVIVSMDKDTIITKWDVLKPRKDFTHGLSCYYPEPGFKVSRMLDKDNNCVYTYCDIIETQYEPETNTYIFVDLLVDVVVYEDGAVRVLDLDEIAHALDKNLITVAQAQKALILTDKLLNIIYSGEFSKLSDKLKNIM